MMVSALAVLAAMRAAKPTAPTPMIAIELPAGTLRTLTTAPAPVCSPQPSGARVSRGAFEGTLTICN